MLPKLIYSHLHVITDILVHFVYEASGNNSADLGSLLTCLSSQHYAIRSRDSVVGRAIGQQVGRSGFRIQARERNFILQNTIVQTGSGDHPVGTGILSQGKAAEA